MPAPLIFSLSALAALLPASIFTLRRGGRNAQYWILLLVAVIVPLAWAVAQVSVSWRTGFSTALWLTIAVSMAIFALLAVATREAWRLTPLLLPYLFVLGVIATVWQQAPGQPLAEAAPAGWLGVHIGVSLLTYALATLAAIAGLAVAVQERALKTKRSTALSRLSPPVADGEALQVALLAASEIVLGLGLLTGVATLYIETGAVFEVSHKSLFSVLAFVVIGGLLLAHRFAGVRGRRAARFVLLAYLLLTLAYPGAKFVTDVLLA